MSEHIVPIRTYVIIFVALMLLTGLTVLVANYDLGKMNAIVALTIAVIKGLLVVLFFMHVKYSSRLTMVFVAAGFVWLVIMVALTLSDYLTRPWIPVTR